MNQQEHKAAAKNDEILFAAANSGRGFISFYDEIFDRREIGRRYIIKGGPGTGKSSFMRTVGAYAESQGKKVAYYRCSSDPDSLDAIVIDKSIVLLDGTAPHCMEPKLAGARDEIINLGEFWDGNALASHYDEIESISTKKSSCYGRAYRYLAAAIELEEMNHDLILPYLKREKMERAADRLLREIPCGNDYEKQVGLRSSIGMRGSVTLDTYERIANRLIRVEDFYGTGHFLLAYLAEGARRKKCRILVSYQPLNPSYIDAVFFEDSGICFLLEKQGLETQKEIIHMRRFVDHELPKTLRSDWRWNRRMAEAMIHSAEGALAEAGSLHFSLEKIYAACMDFDSLNKFVRSFCGRIVLP